MEETNLVEYNGWVLNLARKAVDMAMENKFYQSMCGEVGSKETDPNFRQRFEKFRPSLGELENALSLKDRDRISKAIQEILVSIAEFEKK
jgi:hypothetical protein